MSNGDASAAVEYAYQLIGLIFEADDLIEFRTLGRGTVQRWARLADAEAVIRELHGVAGVQVYFGANPRSRQGGTAADVALARCLFADFDGGTTVEQARIRWQDANLPEPTAIVLSGGGVHAWWRLAEPVADLAEWTRRQKALAKLLGADLSCTDAPRIMRLPGFRNTKYQTAPLCVVADSEADRIYSLDEFPDGAAFANVETKLPLLGAPNKDDLRTMGDLTRRFLENGYVHPKGRRATVFMVACDMAARGWPVSEARPLLVSVARTLGLGPDQLADLPRQIENAYKSPRTPSTCRAEEAEMPADAEPRRPLSLSALLSEFPQMRPPLVEGLLRQAEICNLIAPPKTGKSWLVNSLALSHATGRPWMGAEVTRGRVLIVDNELHKETSAYRLATTAKAMGISVSEIENSFRILNLRGDLQDFNTFGRTVVDHIESGEFSMIILDAFYRFLPADVDENSNGGMAGIYNRLDKWGEETGAAFVCVHHSSKGAQDQKAVTDVGAGAGSMSRAADAHLVLRHHQLENHIVMEAAIRSWAPMPARVMRFDWPLFYLTDENPDELRTAGRKGDGWTPERFADECVTLGGCDGNHIAAKADEFGLSAHRVRTLRAAALGKGLIRKAGGTRDAVWIRASPAEAR
jgi:hypothetical protein